jgi:hypothetical protein
MDDFNAIDCPPNYELSVRNDALRWAVGAGCATTSLRL